METITESSRETQSPIPFTEILRRVGVGSVAVGTLTFILQQYDLTQLLPRAYASILAIAFLLMGGVACALGLREEKSARALFGLSGVFLPALSLTVGGVIYTYCHSETISLIELLPLLLLTAGVIYATPLLFITTLARPFKDQLLPFIVGSSAVLLLPFRDPIATPILAVLLYVAWERLNTLLFQSHSFFSQRTGLFVRIVTALFPLAFLGRANFYNDPSAFTLTVSCLLLSRGSYVHAKSYRSELLYAFCAALMILATVPMVPTLTLIVPLEEWTLVAIISTVVLSIIDVQNKRSFAAYNFTALFLQFTAAFTELNANDATRTTVALLLFVSALRNSWRARSTTLFVFNEILVAWSIGTLISQAVNFKGMSLWCGLLLIGVGLITLSALYERYGALFAKFVFPFDKEFGRDSNEEPIVLDS